MTMLAWRDLAECDIVQKGQQNLVLQVFLLKRDSTCLQPAARINLDPFSLCAIAVWEASSIILWNGLCLNMYKKCKINKILMSRVHTESFMRPPPPCLQRQAITFWHHSRIKEKNWISFTHFFAYSSSIFQICYNHQPFTLNKKDINQSQ